MAEIIYQPTSYEEFVQLLNAYEEIGDDENVSTLKAYEPAVKNKEIIEREINELQAREENYSGTYPLTKFEEIREECESILSEYQRMKSMYEGIVDEDEINSKISEYQAELEWLNTREDAINTIISTTE